MPVCVQCAHPAEYLYTTYRTKSNIRLGPRCDRFLDPLIEHPNLILLLDLILLKPRVYLHLLFNRGTPPLDATITVSDERKRQRDRRTLRAKVLWDDLARLTGLSLLAETAVRLVPLINKNDNANFSAKWMAGIVAAEMLAQHLTAMSIALVVLRLKGWYAYRSDGNSKGTVTAAGEDGRQRNFLPILIPLTVLYTSIIPLLLQLFLSIWYSPPPSIQEALPPTVWQSSFITTLLPRQILVHISTTTLNQLYSFEQEALRLWSTADTIWAGTRLLGGIRSGFGLRVILPTRPWETTLIVLGGWTAATVVGRALEGGMT